MDDIVSKIDCGKHGQTIGMITVGVIGVGAFAVQVLHLISQLKK